MPMSIRTLLASDPHLSEEIRIGIAKGAPESSDRLVALGVDPCEAAELLDDPCRDYPGTGAR